MNSIFSVDDLSDLIWPAPVTDMSRSASEWELERFLEDFSTPSFSCSRDNDVGVSASLTSSKPNQKGEDDLVEIQKPNIHRQQLDRNPLEPPPPPPPPHIDAEEYHAFLKSQLDLACAAAVKSRDLSVEAEGVSSSGKDQRLIEKNCQSGSSPVSGNNHGISKGPNEADSGSVRLPASPSMPKKQELPVRQATSGSSREDSDDDELEGDTETNDNMDPADEKRARRMQSNRESARRSRRRKQAQLNELEAQVGQLRDERTSLLTRLTDINKKCDEASVDNRILNANIETLRTKVKMAEDQVKRVTGLNPLALARSNVPSMGMQFVTGQTNPPVNVPVPGQPNNRHFFHHSVPDRASAASHLQRLNNGCPNNNLPPHATTLPVDNGTSNIGGLASLQQLAIGKTAANGSPLTLPVDNVTGNAGGLASLQRLTNGKNTGNTPPLQHVQKQTSPTAGSPASLPASNNGLSQPVAKDNKKN